MFIDVDVYIDRVGCYHQGELRFSEPGDGQLAVGGPLQQCAGALGVAERALRGALLGRVLAAGGELVSKQHSLLDADYTRLALAKAAYDRLFTWIVQQVGTLRMSNYHIVTSKHNCILTYKEDR